jgi:hypothetical protein
LCYTLVKNPIEYEIGEIEKLLINKGFKKIVVSPRIPAYRQGTSIKSLESKIF